MPLRTGGQGLNIPGGPTAGIEWRRYAQQEARNADPRAAEREGQADGHDETRETPWISQRGCQGWQHGRLRQEGGLQMRFQDDFSQSNSGLFGPMERRSNSNQGGERATGGFDPRFPTGSLVSYGSNNPGGIGTAPVREGLPGGTPYPPPLPVFPWTQNPGGPGPYPINGDFLGGPVNRNTQNPGGPGPMPMGEDRRKQQLRVGGLNRRVGQSTPFSDPTGPRGPMVEAGPGGRVPPPGSTPFGDPTGPRGPIKGEGQWGGRWYNRPGGLFTPPQPSPRTMNPWLRRYLLSQQF